MNVFIIGVAQKQSGQLLASPYMEKELHLLGISAMKYAVSDEAQMKDAFQQAMLMGGLILVPLTGKPAIDNLLNQQTAKACGLSMALNESVFEQIAQRNVKLTREEVAKLSTLPLGAKIYAVQDETCPAYQVAGENIHAILLPADKAEQSAVFYSTVFPTLAKQPKYPCASHSLRVMDLSLPEIEGALKDMLQLENPCTAIYPGKRETIVRVSVRAQDQQQASSACQSALKTIVERLGSYVYGVDVPNVETALLQRLDKQRLHLFVNESGSNRQAEKRLIRCSKSDTVGLSFAQEGKGVSMEGACRMAAAASGGATIGVGISMPTAKEKAAAAYVAACFSGHTLSKELSVTDFKSVQQLSDACVSEALNLARKFADSHPALPKGAAPVTEAMGAVSAVSSKVGEKEEAVPMKEEKASLPKRILSAIFPQKSDPSGEKMRKLGIILCLCVFCGSMAYLMNHHQQGVNAVETNKELTNMKEDFAAGKLDDYEIDEEALAAVRQEVLDQYKPFVAINGDMQGWIEIPETNLSYPVVQTVDNDYYHRRGFDGKDDYYGVPYLDYECSIDVDEVSDNLIIYGHNIGNDGLMFNPLSYYKQLDFYKTHPIVNFDTIYKEQSFKIFGVFITNAEPEQDNGKVFKYWQMVDFDDDSEFNDYVNEVRKRSIWDIDTVDVQPGDQLLTLSTCVYDFRPEARIVIVARQLREGEEATVDTANVVKNEDAYYPQAYYDAMKEKAKYGHVKGISIDGKENITMEVGQTLQLTAKTNPADAPINTATWDSSASAVVTVDAKTGMLTAVAPGEALITAKADDGGYVDTVKVTVMAGAPLEYLYFNMDYYNMAVGQELLLTVNLDPEEAASDLSWSIDSDAIDLEVNKSNPKKAYLYAYEPTDGPVYISVVDNITGLSAECAVQVLDPSAGIPNNPQGGTENNPQGGTTEAPQGGTQTQPSTCQYCGVAAGQPHDVSCMYYEELAFIMDGDEYNEIEGSFMVGDTSQAPTVAGSTAYKWSTSNKGVVTVDQYGNITAVGAGTATITVTGANGGTATIVVTVTGDGTVTPPPQENPSTPETPSEGEEGTECEICGKDDGTHRATCEVCGGIHGEHKEDCSTLVEEEEPQCTCESPGVSFGSVIHDEDCPLYEE